jgi:mono/diheme cytochrome c family protein
MNGHSARLALATLGILAGCSGGNSVPQPGAEDLSAKDTGARLYDANCLACHQQDGRGIPGVYPSLVGSPVVLGDPKELALWVIKGGRPPTLAAGRYPTMMVQFGWLQPADAAALFTYVRSRFGNAAPPVDPATVAQALGPSP